MKYVASIIFALCFAASMVSCSREDGFEKEEEEPLSSISATTELDSSSELNIASSSCAAEPITEETEASTTITTNIEANSTEESTSSTSTTTSRQDKNNQLVETTIEEIVIKPIESTTVDAKIEIVTKPIESTTTLEGPIVVTGIDEYSYQLLAEIVEHEAGSDWISLYDKAHVAAATMNRVYDSCFPNTVYDVLVQPGQYTGYWPGCIAPRSTAYEAVDYYFAHPNEFDNSNSWFGDGWTNYFYYQ